MRNRGVLRLTATLKATSTKWTGQQGSNRHDVFKHRIDPRPLMPSFGGPSASSLSRVVDVDGRVANAAARLNHLRWVGTSEGNTGTSTLRSVRVRHVRW